MNKQYSYAFERAKRLSDIVGMLTRMAFLVLLTTFVAISMQQYSNFLYITMFCTLLVLGSLAIRLAWLTADVFGEAWKAFIIEQFNNRLANGSALTIEISIWMGRLFTFIFLIGLFGLSTSLISYGDTLAKRLLEETSAQTD